MDLKDNINTGILADTSNERQETIVENDTNNEQRNNVDENNEDNAKRNNIEENKDQTNEDNEKDTMEEKNASITINPNSVHVTNDVENGDRKNIYLNFMDKNSSNTENSANLSPIEKTQEISDSSKNENNLDKENKSISLEIEKEKNNLQNYENSSMGNPSLSVTNKINPEKKKNSYVNTGPLYIEVKGLLEVLNAQDFANNIKSNNFEEKGKSPFLSKRSTSVPNKIVPKSFVLNKVIPKIIHKDINKQNNKSKAYIPKNVEISKTKNIPKAPLLTKSYLNPLNTMNKNEVNNKMPDSNKSKGVFRNTPKKSKPSIESKIKPKEMFKTNFIPLKEINNENENIENPKTEKAVFKFVHKVLPTLIKEKHVKSKAPPKSDIKNTIENLKKKSEIKNVKQNLNLKKNINDTRKVPLITKKKITQKPNVIHKNIPLKAELIKKSKPLLDMKKNIVKKPISKLISEIKPKEKPQKKKIILNNASDNKEPVLDTSVESNNLKLKDDVPIDKAEAEGDKEQIEINITDKKEQTETENKKTAVLNENETAENDTVNVKNIPENNTKIDNNDNKEIKNDEKGDILSNDAKVEDTVNDSAHIKEENISEIAGDIPIIEEENIDETLDDIEGIKSEQVGETLDNLGIKLEQIEDISNNASDINVEKTDDIMKDSKDVKKEILEDVGNVTNLNVEKVETVDNVNISNMEKGEEKKNIKEDQKFDNKKKESVGNLKEIKIKKKTDLKKGVDQKMNKRTPKKSDQILSKNENAISSLSLKQKTTPFTVKQKAAPFTVKPKAAPFSIKQSMKSELTLKGKNSMKSSPNVLKLKADINVNSKDKKDLKAEKINDLDKNNVSNKTIPIPLRKSAVPMKKANGVKKMSLSKNFIKGFDLEKRVLKKINRSNSDKNMKKKSQDDIVYNKSNSKSVSSASLKNSMSVIKKKELGKSKSDNINEIMLNKSKTTLSSKSESNAHNTLEKEDTIMKKSDFKENKLFNKKKSTSSKILKLNGKESMPSYIGKSNLINNDDNKNKNSALEKNEVSSSKGIFELDKINKPLKKSKSLKRQKSKVNKKINMSEDMSNGEEKVVTKTPKLTSSKKMKNMPSQIKMDKKIKIIKSDTAQKGTSNNIIKMKEKKGSKKNKTNDNGMNAFSGGANAMLNKELEKIKPLKDKWKNNYVTPRIGRYDIVDSFNIKSQMINSDYSNNNSHSGAHSSSQSTSSKKFSKNKNTDKIGKINRNINNENNSYNQSQNLMNRTEHNSLTKMDIPTTLSSSMNKNCIPLDDERRYRSIGNIEFLNLRKSPSLNMNKIKSDNALRNLSFHVKLEQPKEIKIKGTPDLYLNKLYSTNSVAENSNESKKCNYNCMFNKCYPTNTNTNSCGRKESTIQNFSSLFNVNNKYIQYNTNPGIRVMSHNSPMKMSSIYESELFPKKFSNEFNGQMGGNISRRFSTQVGIPTSRQFSNQLSSQYSKQSIGHMSRYMSNQISEKKENSNQVPLSGQINSRSYFNKSFSNNGSLKIPKTSACGTTMNYCSCI
ncbi:conserved Plasmodium protein, unknown function [Plasmodium berghei]|uniref:Uncharacterized protein n=2 Tax=Plasmodium berghei TaxID=5821 RepID=A0A509AQ64_PLABA|nr:conserved Plasmodium protein, unknown function [Plasmodium berghei ANKA]CXI99387.1 conserved Plasmodium protein, unknown function [Plasmodium berghei]SCL97864.1 conserved Plasmodium protein, unknown function [Plasmodium berghei]SCM16698.1 conserved Plasmodium protein, unknown function [Plasmodium berghei]SCN27929.1 conserved Plasmodium protein, unknown function [Plasmodium berghei]VUC57812.1 conserved Plasmodium protein, unknown function [Plasmodium berghei ANKA]|eukprot:XP_034423582.1 conserved Plasmodium protein, unknown function [Plasmodium berghei ANKA]